MQTRIGAALAALLFGAPASAESVAVRCKIVGPAANCWGALQVLVDETARHVHIKTEKPAASEWDYKDGITASIYAGGAPTGEVALVAQFVKITAARVELGFRGEDGALLHLASFNRSALHGKPCLWRSHWNFGTS